MTCAFRMHACASARAVSAMIALCVAIHDGLTRYQKSILLIQQKDLCKSATPATRPNAILFIQQMDLCCLLFACDRHTIRQIRYLLIVLWDTLTDRSVSDLQCEGKEPWRRSALCCICMHCVSNSKVAVACIVHCSVCVGSRRLVLCGGRNVHKWTNQ